MSIVPSNSFTLDLISIPWVLFFVYWTASILYEAIKRNGKKVEKREPIAVLILTRMFLYIPIIMIFADEAFQTHYPLGLNFLPDSIFVTYAGFAVALMGIIFSIWGRVALGDNWSPDAELKTEQTLVQSGPYSIVRHPIYAGITLGMVGSAIAESNVAALIAVLLILIFSYLRIIQEEKLMKERFGAEWDAYAKLVKRFIPGIW